MNRRYLIACVVLLVLGLLAALAIHRRALSLEQARVVSEIEKMGGRIHKNSSGYVTSFYLPSIQVTDAWLEHLTGLPQLRDLNLNGTLGHRRWVGTPQGVDSTARPAPKRYKGHRRWTGTPQGVDPTARAEPRRYKGHRRWTGTSHGVDSTAIPIPIRHPGHRRWAGTPQGVAPTAIAEPKRYKGHRRWTGTPQGVDPAERAVPRRTQVTDAGLEHLKGLTQLQGLSLSGTQVTDAGLEHLKGLTQLQIAVPRRYPGHRRWTGTPQRVDPTPDRWTSTAPRSLTLGWNTSKG